MRKICKFLILPLSFAETSDLSLPAKWVALMVDSYTDNPMGVAMGVRAIQTATNLSAKEVKEALTELKEKGALQVNLGAEGEKLLKVLLYKDRYVSGGEQVVVGDTPTDREHIDFAYIQEQWNEICRVLPKLERMTPSRKSRVRSVLKQSDLSVGDFIKCFKIIACTPFLSGETDKFRCTFDWLTSNSKNVTKVWEGFYARSFQEKRDHELIRNGGEVDHKQDPSEDFYR